MSDLTIIGVGSAERVLEVHDTQSVGSGFNELIEGARVVLSLEVLDEELLRTWIAGLATCSAAQSKTLVWLDEVSLAASRAQTHTQKLNELARLMPVDVMMAKLGGNADAAAQHGYAGAAGRCRKPAFLLRAACPAGSAWPRLPGAGGRA